jgi:7-cyano-7-deazaguanine synthase in queuosine biosynthesis
MKTIKIVDVDIDIHDGPIGISLSGGADSSLLFYILMKYAPGPIHVFSCGNGNTNYHEPTSAIRIINYCVNQFNRTDVYFYAHWVTEKNITNMFAKETIQSCNLSILYNGFTRPPPEGEIVNYDTTGPIAVGGVDHKKMLPTYWTKENNDLIRLFFGKDLGGEKPLYTPFINVNKKKLAKIYASLGIQDLYSKTRSCESLTLTTGHCSTCWWCKERIWAFGYLE